MRPNAARGEEGARVPDSRPSVRRPRKPLGEGEGRDHGSWDRATPERGRGASRTPPRGGVRALQPAAPTLAASPGSLQGPGEEGPPGPGRDPGAPAARTPPASRGGPPRACPCRGRRRGTKRGRWRANPEPPGPPPAPGRGPSAPPAHMPAPRKLSQGRARRGAAAARPRLPAPTAARPARPERCRPEATQARGPQTPEPPPPPLPAASPSHTPPALPGSCRPLPGSQPVQQPPHASREESTGRGCARRPGFPPPAGSRLPGLRRATPRGPEPGPATNRSFPAWCSPLGRRCRLQPPPASRSGARLPSSLARRPSASFLSRGLSVFPPSPPPHPPKSRVPGSAAPR